MKQSTSIKNSLHSFFWILVLFLFIYVIATITLNITIRNAQVTESFWELSFSFFASVLVILILTAFATFCFLSGAFNEKVILKKAITLDKAMRMLNLPATGQKYLFFKNYNIAVYRTKEALTDKIHENLSCKTIFEFFGIFYFSIDRINALNSPYYCCDFEQVEELIKSLKLQWGMEKETELVKLEEKCTALQNENTTIKEQLQAHDLKYDELQAQNVTLVATIAEKETLLSQAPSVTSSSEKKVEEHLPILVNASIKMLCADMPVTGYTTGIFKTYVDKSIIEITQNNLTDTNKVESKPSHIAKKWIDLAWAGIPEKFRNKSGASSSKKIEAPINS